MLWAIIILSVLFYCAGWKVMAQFIYNRYRPYTEPLNCQRYIECQQGDHPRFCYEKPGSICDEGEARFLGLVWGTFWFLMVFPLLLMKSVARIKETPQERAAAIARLEKETDASSPHVIRSYLEEL